MVLHFLWTFLVFGGAIYMLVVPSYAIVQIVVLSITLLSSLPFRGLCPVTTLEKSLRRKVDPSYENHGSFMTTYTNKILGTNLSTRPVNVTIAVLYILCYSYAIIALVHGA
jgi:hypothetical protein